MVKKSAADAKSKKVGGADKKKKQGDGLETPKRIIRRFALRSGAVRCAKSVYPVADKLVRDTIDRYVLPAMRSVTQDGRLTVKTRDIRRAMRINRTSIY